MKKIVLILQFMLLSFATYAQEQTSNREKSSMRTQNRTLTGP